MANLHLFTASSALVLACLVTGLNGSSIHFQSSATAIKPLVSQNFSLRCSLSDTSPAPGSPGAVVGKRSVATPRREVTERQVLEDHRRNKDTFRSVTTTAENVMLITSIIISRDGTDIASIIDHFSAKPVGGGATNYHVTGQLTPAATEKGYLQVTWPHPSPQDAGSFRCDVDTLSVSGHSYDFSDNLTVVDSEVTLEDLVIHLSGQQSVIDDLVKSNTDLTQSNANLNQSNAALTQSNSALKQSFSALTQSIATLKQSNNALNRTIKDLIQKNADLNRTEAAFNNRILQLESEKVPDVFFSAALTTGSTSISAGHVFVYNSIWVNQGGAYDNSTGIFTAPVTGYYHFTMTGIALGGHSVFMDLKKNGSIVAIAWGQGDSGNYHSATGTYIIKLVKGDKVQVVGAGASTLASVNSNKENTFTGRLIALD